MANKIIKNKIEQLHSLYKELSLGNEKVLHEIAMAEIPEMVYNSNAIENSTLTLEDTEQILIEGVVPKRANTREVYEAKNLAKITEYLLNNPNKMLSVRLILDLHKILLSNIENNIAGRFRSGKEWVRVGNHLGANPLFVASLMEDLLKSYNAEKQAYFLDNIAYFHAEFETIHPFCDGNGRMGRVIINQQLMKLGYPPIIIQNKSKFKDYYALFTSYPSSMKFDGFTSLFAVLLLESLHKRLTYLTARRIVPLSIWAKQNAVKGNVAANKAKRQTIPAFRLREKWVISENYRENIDVLSFFTTNKNSL